MFEANELKNKNLDYMLRIFLFCIFIRRQLSKSLQQCRTNVGIFMGNHFFFISDYLHLILVTVYKLLLAILRPAPSSKIPSNNLNHPHNDYTKADDNPHVMILLQLVEYLIVCKRLFPNYYYRLP